MEKRYLLAVLVFLALFAVVIQQRSYTGHATGLIEDNDAAPVYVDIEDSDINQVEQPDNLQPQAQPPVPQSQQMHAPVPQRVPLSASAYSMVLSRMSSPNTFGGRSTAYYIPFFDGAGGVYVWDLGPNGYLDGDDGGLRLVQGNNQIWMTNLEPTPAFGDTILYLLLNGQASPQFWAIFAKDTGSDGRFGTDNEGAYIVAVPYGGFRIPNYEAIYDLVPNGALYRVNDGQTTYLIRHNPVDGIFQALGLPPPTPPTNDIIEVIRRGVTPLPLPVRPATSLSRLVTWVDYPQQINLITNLLGPGPNSRFGDTDDEYYTFGGSSVDDVGLINYDGSAVLTSMTYSGVSQAALYDLRPTGINGPLGIDGYRGRIPMAPQFQNIPLPIPQGTVMGPVFVDLDVNGAFINHNGQRIDGEGVFAFKVNATDGRNIVEVTIIVYFNPGPNNRWLDSDDKVVVYQDSSSRFDVYDIYVKEEFVTFRGTVNRVGGLYHWAV